MKEKFHTFVAKLLYLSKRTRPDITLVIGFLTTRVKGPNQDDWNRLVRCIAYLNQTVELPLKLSCRSDPLQLKWWTDASHAVHVDSKGQTGGVNVLR